MRSKRPKILPVVAHKKAPVGASSKAIQEWNAARKRAKK